MALGPEYTRVERPLLDQLTGMGWLHIEGAPPEAFVPTAPTASCRKSFSEVFLTDQIRQAIYRINRDPNDNPWMTSDRLSQAVSALTNIGATSLLAANEGATKLLRNGMTVQGVPGWDGGRDRRVHYIDWDNPHNNDFVVISQFRVNIPGGQGRKFIVPTRCCS